MSCRDATPADLDALARINVAAWRAAYAGLMDPTFLESLGAAHALSRLGPALQVQPPLVVVAEDAGAIVGFSRFGPSRDSDATSSTGEVFACNVDPQYWRRGFGAQVMTAACARLAQSGYTTCNLWVLERNQRARQFYAALQFKPDGATRVEAAATAYPLRELRYARSI